MKFAMLIFVVATFLSINSNAHAQNCPKGEVSFSFNDLKAITAFSIFADYSGLKANIDPSITYSSPMNFACTPWEVAAKALAKKYNLNLKIEDGILYVSKK